MIDDASSIINASPGRTSEALPNSPAPAAAATADKTKVGKPRGPYKKKDRVAAPDVPPEQKPGLQSGVNKIPLSAQARSINQAFETGLIIVMGDEAALDEAEKIALDTGLVEYMKVKNYDLPPGLALCMCYCMIVAGKIQKPKPKEKIVAFWLSIKAKFARKKKDYPTEKGIAL